MSISITLGMTGNIGSINMSHGTGNLGVYVNTGGVHGVAVTANQLGLGRIDSVIIDAAGGYTFEYVVSTGRIKAYYGDGGLQAHVHDVLVISGQASVGTSSVSYYATDILGKEAAIDKTIAGADSATKGGVMASTATAGSPVEVTDSVDLTAVVFNFRAYGT